jgi:hypothetical protein
MTPKEKAEELFDKMMYHIMYNCQPTLSDMVAKQCALIAVDEILWEIIKYADNSREYVVENSLYWQEVKQEIEKLGGQDE